MIPTEADPNAQMITTEADAATIEVDLNARMAVTEANLTKQLEERRRLSGLGTPLKVVEK